MGALRTWFAGVWKDASRKVDLQQLDRIDETAHEHQMVRSLGFKTLVFMGIANVIGAGIFVTTGTIAHDYAGSAVSFSYMIAGFVAMLAALCYAKNAARVRGNGSAVSYAYSTMGELPGYLIGFDLLLEMTIGAAAVASGWAANLTTLIRIVFNKELPARWVESPAEVNWLLLLMTVVFLGGGALLVQWARKRKCRLGAALTAIAITGGASLFVCGLCHGWQFVHDLPSINVPAAGIVLVVTGILLFGVQHTARFTIVLTVIKLIVLAIFIVLAGANFNSANLHPMLHPAWGVLGVFKGASIAFFAFVGFETLTAGAAECKDPQRDIPRAIKWVVSICTVLYMLAAGLLVASVSYTALGGKEGAAPMARAAEILGYPSVSVAICAGSLVSLWSVLVVGQYGEARIACTLSRFGLLPPFLGKLTKRSRVPLWATVIPGIAIASASALLPVDELLELCNIGTLAAFALVCGAVIVLNVRDNKPVTKRDWFKAAWMPTLGILGCLTMMGFLPLLSWVRFFAWMAIGVGLYLWKGRHNSFLNKLQATK
jgi:APA family basic amino acid/polyamine antiporter